ncbi:hypothetical protein [Denitromonas sp.]|uniref:hypothetical protein n=1 Tax=Denitromonas sp. TaxID=2734609 RepID=UPI003A8C3B23
MWRRFVILLLLLILPLPPLAVAGGGCASDTPPASHRMADVAAVSAAPCCADVDVSGGCAQLDCAASAIHCALPAAAAGLSARVHVLHAAPMPGFRSVTVSRHDRPPIPAA